MEEGKEQPSKQAMVQFSTKLPEKYQVPNDPITIDTSMATKELNSVSTTKLTLGSEQFN